jgi:hypothetical protein
MISNASARTTPAATHEPDDRSAALTRTLLAYGLLAGPFYLAVGLIQALVREGFDFARHPLSVLANGPGGWVQTANFLLSGLMVIAAAVGVARSMRPRGRVTSGLLALYGVALITAAAFPADAVDGFPPGTPEGFPTTVSTTGVLHFVAGGVAFLAIAASCLAAAMPMFRRNERSMALLSLLAGVAIVGGFFGPFVIPGFSLGMAGIWFAVVVGWVWLAALCVHLRGASRPPTG